MKIPKLFLHIFESNTRLIPVFGILLLAIAVPLTLNLIEQNQDNRQQAAENIVSIQNTTACQAISGECVREDSANPEFSCFAVEKNGTDNLCGHPNEVCCTQKNPTTENSTCEADGKSCDYSYSTLQECEATQGVGNCEIFANLNCINNNKCFEIKNQSTSPTPKTCQGQCHASQTVCESNNTGKLCVADTSSTCTQSGTTCFTVGTFPPLGAACPDGSGNYSCGFGTPDTQCAVCSTNASCTTNNYSIARCSSGPSCSTDADCAGRPSSCPAGTTGVVNCVQNSCQTVNCQ
jgi:hypothetical protein